MIDRVFTEQDLRRTAFSLANTELRTLCFPMLASDWSYPHFVWIPWYLKKCSSTAKVEAVKFDITSPNPEQTWNSESKRFLTSLDRILSSNKFCNLKSVSFEITIPFPFRFLSAANLIRARLPALSRRKLVEIWEHLDYGA